MTHFESPDIGLLQRRNLGVAERGGAGVDHNIADGMSYAMQSNEAYDKGDVDAFATLTKAAGILIGKGSLGGLEMSARAVRERQGPTPVERDPSLDKAMRNMLLGKFAVIINRPPFDMTTDELMLETARGMHQMRSMHGMGVSVLAPMELWNRDDVLEEAVITGLHPMVAWSARGTADDIDDSTPLYGEYIMTDMRVRRES